MVFPISCPRFSGLSPRCPGIWIVYIRFKSPCHLTTRFKCLNLFQDSHAVSFPGSLSLTLGFTTHVGSRVFKVSYRNLFRYFSSFPLFLLFIIFNLRLPAISDDPTVFPLVIILAFARICASRILIRQPFLFTPAFFSSILVPCLSSFIVLLPFFFFFYCLPMCPFFFVSLHSRASIFVIVLWWFSFFPFLA